MVLSLVLGTSAARGLREGGKRMMGGSTVVEKFVWVPNNSNFDWAEHAKGAEIIQANLAIVTPLAPGTFDSSGNCFPFAPKTGGNAGYPGAVAQQFCNTFGNCQVWMGLSWTTRHNDFSVSGLKTLLTQYESCMKNGDGQGHGAWPKAPSVTGVMCIEGGACSEALTSAETLGLKTGYLENQYISSGLDVAGGEFYNYVGGTCSAYGSTASEYGKEMATQANAQSKGRASSAATGFAGYAGAVCPAPSDSSSGDDLSAIVDAYFAELDPSLPRNFGIWG